ncbi:hypothetical protein BDZ94DRAFT_1268195 [Collybia nuda]|uniref:RING-type domain-containing protein n=1 Tax=Collybia nuda TaxID=64659 RepID=A0A9P6CFX6_9AGAR|nr:hypothetical protein BDZ94DRAFT_1268195 [Collybia nuda]
MKQLLSSFEDELTCPICCDLFVAAHVGNPCGHSVCGDCGWLWSKKNKDGGCSVCRTKMSKELPMIPNIAIDNLVEKHVQALGSSGDKDWLPNGTKFTEWSFRKKKWKMDAALRAKAKVPARRKAVEIFDFLDPIDLNLAQWIAPDDEDDGDYVNDDIEEHGPTAEHQPRRRRLRSRAAWRQAGHS